MKQLIYKVPGGKMLRLFLEADHGKITKIRITGDFFMHPEENLKFLEESLLGVDLENKDLLAAMQTCLSQHPTELYGFGPEDLTTAILEAYATN